jgi:hypothetical protein
MAGMHYQDQTEGSTTPAPSPSPLQDTQNYPPEILDDLLGDRLASNTTTPSERSISIRSEPMASQWAAIRSLRKETEFHHKRFQALARSLENPIISNLLEIYPDAQSIRTQGACIVKDVLEGFQPDKLSHVFAFTCFSYAISLLLYKKDGIDKSDILADIRVWRDLISDPKERQAFNHLAPELWPETKEHLHFIEIPARPASGTTQWVNDWPHLASSAEPAGYSAPHIPTPHPNRQTTTNNTDPVHLPDSYNFDNRNLPLTSDSIDLLMLSHDMFDFSAVDLSNSQSEYQQPADTGWPQASGPTGEVSFSAAEVHPTALNPSSGEREGAEPDIKPSEDVKLEKTIMFLVILVFLRDLGDWYLYTLSGRSLAPKRHKLYQAQQGDQEAFHRKAQKVFFEPCSRHRSSTYSAFRALASVAEMFTQSGYLQSIAEIKQYMISVASVSSVCHGIRGFPFLCSHLTDKCYQAVLLPGDAYEQIVSSVLTISDDLQVAPTQAIIAKDAQKRPRSVDGNASSPEPDPRPAK